MINKEKKSLPDIYWRHRFYSSAAGRVSDQEAEAEESRSGNSVETVSERLYMTERYSRQN